jgi:hypothetical protein
MKDYELRPAFDRWIRSDQQRIRLEQLAKLRRRDDPTIRQHAHQLYNSFVQSISNGAVALTTSQTKLVESWCEKALRLVVDNGTANMVWVQDLDVEYSSNNPNKRLLIDAASHKRMGAIGHALLGNKKNLKGEPNHGILEIGVVVSAQPHYRYSNNVDDQNYYSKEIENLRSEVRREYLGSSVVYDTATKKFDVFVGKNEPKTYTDFASGNLSRSKKLNLGISSFQ